MTAPAPETAGGGPPAYPAHWAADVVLRDGSVARLRPIRPQDADGVRRFHAGQSEDSIYLRFFAPLKELSARDLHRFTNVDYVRRVALVATVADAIIGIARYEQVDPSSAEVAFNVADSYQGRGVGSVLLEHLVSIAQEQGISNFVAEVLPQNQKMLNVFADTGYAVTNHYDDGVVYVSFRIEPTARSEQIRDRREHDSEAVSVRALLNPRSIAVVGAGRRAEAVGHRLLHNILTGGFAGSVFAVNAEAEQVQGLAGYARVSDISEPVDLAVLAVPPEAVLDVVGDCAEAGVRSLVVASGGFAETGPEGEERQAALLRIARTSGMRVVGPNSVGISNSAPEVGLNATLAAALPPPGGLGLFTQSGALGIAVLSWAARRHLGVSSFASAGNRVDVSGSDLMQYWLDDDRTLAVGLYLESMGNPRKFSRLARRLAARKPVIVLKAMVSTYNAPPGHRTRRTRVAPEAFEAMLRQAGVIRVDDLHQLFDVAQLVVHQPIPKGRRVAIVGNSPAMGALTAEACLSWGLQVAHGPVSVPTEVSVGQFADALAAAFADPHVDSVLACLIPPLVTSDTEMAAVVAERASDSDKTCVATFLGMRGRTRELSEGIPEEQAQQAVPAYAMPEDAVRALAAATEYGQWRARDWGSRVAPGGIDRESAERQVERVLQDCPAGRQLTPDEVTALLRAYGVEVWPAVPVVSADEAVEAAGRLGYPVVVKSLAPAMRHVMGFTGIRVDLNGPLAVREAFEALTDRLSAQQVPQLVVQRMAAEGVACVVGASEDELFGPVVTFSVAGPPGELLGDIGYRIPPLTDVDVSDLIGSVRAAPLLHGYRGATPVDDAALRDLVARVSVLTDELPELAGLALDPVVAHPLGVSVLGAEAHVAPARVRTDTDRRALS